MANYFYENGTETPEQALRANVGGAGGSGAVSIGKVTDIDPVEGTVSAVVLDENENPTSVTKTGIRIVGSIGGGNILGASPIDIQGLTDEIHGLNQLIGTA